METEDISTRSTKHLTGQTV